MRPAALITAAALALALAGCSQAQDTQQPQAVNTVGETPDAPTVYKPGTYEYSANGGTVTMEIPAKDLTAPEIAEIEQLRTDLKAPEVTYILGDIDNWAA